VQGEERVEEVEVEVEVLVGTGGGKVHREDEGMVDVAAEVVEGGEVLAIVATAATLGAAAGAETVEEGAIGVEDRVL